MDRESELGWLKIGGGGLLIGAMFILDHPEGVDDLTLLVVRYLLEVQVSRIVCLQARVAIVLKKRT